MMENNKLQQFILESYEEQKFLELLENFLISISENFEVTMTDDCSYEDLMEELSQFDFEGNSMYAELSEASKNQKRRKTKTNRNQKRSTPANANKKAEVKRKAAPKEAPASNASSTGPKEAPAMQKTQDLKPSGVNKDVAAPGLKGDDTTQKPETKADDTPKPEKKGKSKNEELEKLRAQAKEIKDKIAAKNTELEKADPNNKIASDAIIKSIDELNKEKLAIDKKVAKVEEDEERQERLANLEPIIAKKAELNTKIREIHKLQDDYSKEEDPEKKSEIKANIERAKSDKGVIAKELDDLKGSSKEAEDEVNTEIGKEKADSDKAKADNLAKLQAAKTKLTDLKSSLKDETDPDKKDVLKAQITDAKNAVDKAKEADMPDDYKEEDNDTSAEDKAVEDKDKEQALRDQIEKAETAYTSFLEDIDKSIKSQKENTNGLVGGALGKANFFCWLFIMKERNRNRVEFLEQLMKLIPNPEAKKNLDDQIKKAQEALKKHEDQMKDAEKRGEESAEETDPKKLEQAKAESESSEEPKSDEAPKGEEGKKEDDSEGPLIPGTVEYEKAQDKKKAEAERKEKLKNKNSEEKPSDKEAKIKAIDDVLKPQADKLAKIKAAVSKIEDPKRKEQASVNVEKLEKAIAELKKRKEALGESFTSFENEVWAIDVLIEALSSEIDNYLIYG